MSHRTRTWAHFALILTVVLLSISVVFAQETKPAAVGLRPDAPQYALHGSYWVGTMSLSHTLSDGRSTQAELWYPALNPKGAKEDVSYVVIPPSRDLLIFGHAIEQAAPDVEHGPYPLVVLVHGLNDIRLALSNLGEHLASWGFVVMAIDYPDNWFTQDQTDLLPKGLYTRPAEISSQLDFAAELTGAGGKLAAMIDLKSVAVAGHSLGGMNALTTAGAQLDLDWYSRLAVEHPEICIFPPEAGGGDHCAEILKYQSQLAKLAGLDSAPKGLWPAWTDARVGAIVGLAPAGEVFSTEGLRGVKVPTMIMAGTADRWVNSEVNSIRIYPELASKEKALVVLEGADHHVYSQDCKAAPFLVDQFYWACSDPVWDMDRAHDLINHFTTAFLLDVLKGDKDAHAALLPDAVKFVGIEYKTTMQ